MKEINEQYWIDWEIDCIIYFGILGLVAWNFVSINFLLSSSVPIRPHVRFIWMRLELLPPSPPRSFAAPLNLLLFSRLIPFSLPTLFCLLLLLLLCGGLGKSSSLDVSWTLFKPFGVMPVTRIMCVGRRNIVGMGSGNSPCWARAVNERAHNFRRTPSIDTSPKKNDQIKVSIFNCKLIVFT